MVCHLNKKGKNEFSNVISREAKTSVTEECVVAWLLFYFCAVLQAVSLFFYSYENECNIIDGHFSTFNLLRTNMDKRCFSAKKTSNKI